MNILVIGSELNLQECQLKFGDAHSYKMNERHSTNDSLTQHDVIFDFVIESDPSQIKIYNTLSNTTLFLNTAKVTLARLNSNASLSCPVFGFVGLPTFLNRSLLETSVYKPPQKSALEGICKRLDTKFQIVEDRVGMITPRVICMIINEAYFTVEEGTATREDIDLAMKLGTNYPYGPFEWCQKIGPRHVYELLTSVYADTKDERYKTCALLEAEFN